ncbi:MAG: N-acetylmuramoyl-L-alanine amidase [Muribaculaceae bacterium]|nr:N-acetylmuramoyl-L-alanine amidase [Muribaculaceae bacterium]
MQTIKRGSRGADVKTLQAKLNLYPDGIFGPLTEEAVKQFQREKGLTADGIAGANTWRALGFVISSNKRNIDEIIVHYTATPQGEEFSNAQIRASHLARGFSDIGYHYVIGLNGEIRPGRSESIAGAHCTGHNSRSIGVCYVGGCPPRSVKGWQNIGIDTRTEPQKKALLSLIRQIKTRYPRATVHGHREFANKPCPGFDAKEEYKSI